MIPENIKKISREHIMRIFVGVTIFILLMTVNALGASFRLPVTVGAAGFERIDKPVDVSVDFTQLLNSIGQSGTIDENSIRVAETNSLWSVIDTSVIYQFDKDSGYDATTKASGIVAFIMKGTTPASGNRYYYIYFNLTGGSSSPASITPQVTIIDSVIDEGQSSYRIDTANSAYYFHKQAGGFSSWNDKNGNDWISWNTNSGPAGKYRGIPNAGFPEGIFHPGFTCCASSIVSQGPIKIKIRSVSTDGNWESTWSFYSQYATMAMTKVGHSYWFLYEGTPGGVLDQNTDFMVRSNGVKTYLNQSWYGDISSNEWTYFSDPNVGSVGRSLFITHHTDDTLQDEYWPDQYMTVFGFGRSDSPLSSLMFSVPQYFTIGLIDGTDFSQNSKLIYSAYKNLAITKGTVQQYGGTTSQQLILLDVTYDHTNSTKAFSLFDIPSGIPSNLVSPVDYAHGTLYQRLQVFTKPSSNTVKYQFCIFQDQIITSKHACSDQEGLVFTNPGTYYDNQNMVTLFQYNNISWDRSLLKELLAIKDKNGIPIDDRYGWNGLWYGSPNFDLYYPMNVRYTAIIVPPGGGSPIWPGDKQDLSITSWSPLTDPSTTVNIPQTFSVDFNKNADIVWTIDNSAVQSDLNVLTSSYTDSLTDAGIYNVIATITDGTDTISKEWIWTVESEPSQTVYIPPPPIITYTTGNFWINYIVNPDTGSGTNKTDSLNVSLDDGVTWQDGIVPNTNFNITIDPHGQGSILAVAHNNTGGTSQTSSENVQLANNIPVLDPIGDKIVVVGNELTFTVNAVDADGDTITYSKDVAKGDLDSASGVYSWIPNNGDIGIHTVIVSSDDGHGGIDSETIKITVTNNQPMTYMPPTPVNLVCTQGNFWIYCTWQPGEGNNTDSYNINIDGILTNETTDNSVNITTGPHQQKNISIRSYNNSGEGSLNPVPVSKDVQMNNNMPVQTAIGNKVVIVGQILTFTVHATDPDGDTITYNTSATKGSFNSSTATYSWTPNSSDAGTYTWSFCSKDSYEVSTCETMTITVNTNNGGNGGNNGGSNGGSSSGGTEGGTSGEKFYNIEYKYRHELDIHKDIVASYVFTDKRSPIMFVNITGNSSNIEVIGMMEVLKNRSSLLKTSAPGLVYKNVNIWIGTSNFATPKNIKYPAKITFRIENSWIDKNSVIRDNIKMTRWNGKKWTILDTLGKMKDDNYTYFDANTDGFTHFAIIDSKNIKGEKSEYTVPTYTTEKPDTNQSNKPKVKQTATITPNPKKTPGFEAIIGMTIFLIIYMIRQNKR